MVRRDSLLLVPLAWDEKSGSLGLRRRIAENMRAAKRHIHTLPMSRMRRYRMEQADS
jgi:hypothetical protein